MAFSFWKQNQVQPKSVHWPRAGGSENIHQWSSRFYGSMPPDYFFLSLSKWDKDIDCGQFVSSLYYQLSMGGIDDFSFWFIDFKSKTCYIWNHLKTKTKQTKTIQPHSEIPDFKCPGCMRLWVV